MRVALIINLYPPYVVGGNEMISHQLVKTLRQRGHQIHVLTAQGERFRDAPHLCQVLNYDLGHKNALFRRQSFSLPELFRHHVFDLATYRSVRRTVEQLSPDLIVVDNQYLASAAPLLAVRDAPCPVVAQAMDKWLLYNLVDWGTIVSPRTWVGRSFVRLVRRLVQQPIAQHVRLDGIATVSNFIRDFYINAGFDPEIMHTVHLGYDSSVFKPAARGPLHDPVRLMYAGALWEGKGPQVVVEALKILNNRKSSRSFHLSVFGEGADEFVRSLQRVVEANGVEQHVSFLGFVPWSDLARAMQTSDIFVFSSIWDEPFATVPLQAAACGLPIVATTAGGTAEALKDGQSALLIPPDDAPAMADAILRLTRDDALRRRIGRTAANDAQERWTFDAYVDRFWQVCMSTKTRWEQQGARS